MNAGFPGWTRINLPDQSFASELMSGHEDPIKHRKPMKLTPSANSTRFRGFTLIEILISITIIIVIAGLAMMGTRKLREKADVVTTMKRIAGFAQANALYAVDHGGRYVPAYSFDEESKPGIPWHYNPSFLEALIGENLSVEEAEEFEGVDGLPEQVLDPKVVREKKRYWSRISASFAYNNENVPGGGWGEPGTSRAHTTATLKNPSEAFAFITATDWIANYGGRFLWKKSPVEGKTNDSKIAYRHGDKAVVAFYDGHTETMSMEEMRQIDKLGGINNVFWGGDKRSR
jgi:prepilin-type N-terminal cleavage/methylation domain-containing protein/prepilin-type processing-associated H-X9-DG protein